MDGVLTVSFEPIPGSVDALHRLRAMSVPFKIVTNWTGMSRAALGGTLRRAGFDVADDDLLTAPIATAAYLRREHPGAKCFLLGEEGDVMADLGGIDWVQDGPDILVVGGADRSFGFDTMNRALRMLVDGAALVSMHRNLSWMTAEGLALDSGAYLLGLEAATGAKAYVTGKPSPEFFRTGLDALELPTGRVAMVGDDVESDVLAAQALGMTGVLVRTGKVLPGTVERASGHPDLVVESFADVPDMLAAWRP